MIRQAANASGGETALRFSFHRLSCLCMFLMPSALFAARGVRGVTSFFSEKASRAVSPSIIITAASIAGIIAVAIIIAGIVARGKKLEYKHILDEEHEEAMEQMAENSISQSTDQGQDESAEKLLKEADDIIRKTEKDISQDNTGS
jgi:hypothetical protein